jgi:hypothetical protein
MKSELTDEFIKCFADLPDIVQKTARKKYKLLTLGGILLTFAKIQNRGFMPKEVTQWQLLLPLVPN